MHPRDLSPTEIADLLDAAYREDRKLGTTGPNPAVRLKLADYLGCHPEVRSEVWAAWRDVLLLEGEIEENEAEFWLDVDFVEPCPQ